MQLAPESRAPPDSEVPAAPDRHGGPEDLNAHLPVDGDFKGGGGELDLTFRVQCNWSLAGIVVPEEPRLRVLLSPLAAFVHDPNETGGQEQELPGAEPQQHKTA